MRSLLLTLSVLIFAGCASTPPAEEYTLARTALEAARDQDAARYAPSYWHRAEESYREGETHFKNHEFQEASEAFIRSKDMSEKAENAARVQKLKSGETVP